MHLFNTLIHDKTEFCFGCFLACNMLVFLHLKSKNTGNADNELEQKEI